MASRQLPKLTARVRFPSPALRIGLAGAKGVGRAKKSLPLPMQIPFSRLRVTGWLAIKEILCKGDNFAIQISISSRMRNLNFDKILYCFKRLDDLF